MKQRFLAPVVAYGCLALLCFADSAPVLAQRGSSPSRSSPSPSRPSASPQRSAPQRSAPQRSAPQRSAPQRSAPQRSSPQRSAPQRSAPQRSAPQRSAPQRSTPRVSAPRSAPIRSAPTVQRSTPQRATPTPQRSAPTPQRATPTPQRASAPAPRATPTPTSTPRAQPAAPRYQPPETPRYQPPRYQPPETPRSEPSATPRYIPPDNSGRVYDGGRRGNDAGSTSGPAGARAGAILERATANTSAYPPRADGSSGSDAERGPDGTWNGVAFERVTPRTPIPTLSGSSRGPGAGRLGQSSRAALAAGKDAAAGREGLTIPRSQVSRESILQRYPGATRAESATPAEGRTREGSGSTPELSRARGFDTGRAADASRTHAGRANAVSTDAGRTDAARTDALRGRTSPARSADAASRRAEPPARGSLEAVRREREASDRFDRLRASNPERAREIGDVGAGVADATNVAASVTIGASLAFGTGCSSWFWQPCSTGSWYWYGCNGWPIWTSHCGYAWPFGWGFSWWGSGWGFSWNSHCYSPWSYGYYSPWWYCSYYPYSYAYWSPSPSYYSTVVYQGYDDGYGDGFAAGAEYAAPAARGAGEGVIAVDPDAEAAANAGPVAVGRSISQFLSLGDEAFSQGRYSDAVHYYARAVEAAPDEGVLYLILSDALFATGDYHYAAYALRRALELDRNLLSTVVDKHEFYGKPEEFDRQIEVAQNYLEEHYLDDDARLVLAANYLFANRPAQSADLLLSAFSKSVRESLAGEMLLRRAEEMRKERSLYR